jgi:hypothetical protein
MRSFAYLLALVLFFVATPLRADEITERAHTHFSNGVRLYDATPPDYEAALAEFLAAYAAKPVASIKRNVALCQRGLKRYGDAIDTLEEMLVEGGDSIRPEVREAARKAIKEMVELVTVVRLKVLLHAAPMGTRPPVVEVSIDGRPIPADRFAAPLRLGAGDHILSAHASGYSDTSQGILVTAGQAETPVMIEMYPVSSSVRGRLHVRADVPTTSIAIDGVPLAFGEWEGDLGAGTHRLELTAKGYPLNARDVLVAPNAYTDVPVAMNEPVPTAAPPEVTPAKPRAPAVEAEHKFYVMAGGALEGGSRTHRTAAFEDSNIGAADHAYGGGALVVKGGWRVNSSMMLEVWSELGSMKPSTYPGPTSAPATVSVTYFDLGPELRFRTKGKVRFVVGTGFGFNFESVVSHVAQSPKVTADHHGSGVSGVWVAELGVQVAAANRLFLEASGFMEIYGTGAATSGGPRFYLDSPGVRGGIRLYLGFDL